MGYRHQPLSQRLGLTFSDGPHWAVDLSGAECYGHLLGGLRSIFSDADTLYIEGRALDADVSAFYAGTTPKNAAQVLALDRNPATQRYHVPLTKANHQRLALFAASKTYTQMGEQFLIYRGTEVLVDGALIGDRKLRVSGTISEAQLRRFIAGRLKGVWTYVEGS